MTGFKIQTRARMMMWMIFSTRAFHAYASKKSSTNCGMLRFVGQCYMMEGAMGIGGGSWSCATI